MKIEFQPSSVNGLKWFRRYYEQVFLEGRKNGLAKYRQAIKILRENPKIGPLRTGYSDVREFAIVRTPFSFVYIIGILD